MTTLSKTDERPLRTQDGGAEPLSAAVALNVCFSRPRPPVSTAAPSTSRRLPRIAPTTIGGIGDGVAPISGLRRIIYSAIISSSGSQGMPPINI